MFNMLVHKRDLLSYLYEREHDLNDKIFTLSGTIFHVQHNFLINVTKFYGLGYKYSKEYVDALQREASKDNIRRPNSDIELLELNKLFRKECLENTKEFWDYWESYSKLRGYQDESEKISRMISVLSLTKDNNVYVSPDIFPDFSSINKFRTITERDNAESE